LRRRPVRIPPHAVRRRPVGRRPVLRGRPVSVVGRMALVRTGTVGRVRPISLARPESLVRPESLRAAAPLGCPVTLVLPVPLLLSVLSVLSVSLHGLRGPGRVRAGVVGRGTVRGARSGNGARGLPLLPGPPRPLLLRRQRLRSAVLPGTGGAARQGTSVPAGGSVALRCGSTTAVASHVAPQPLRFSAVAPPSAVSSARVPAAEPGARFAP